MVLQNEPVLPKKPNCEPIAGDFVPSNASHKLSGWNTLLYHQRSCMGLFEWVGCSQPIQGMCHVLSMPESNPKTDGLLLRVKFQCIVTHFSPPTRFFVSAKWEGCIEDVVAVDPHCSRIYLRSNAMRFAKVGCPDPCGQPIGAVVCHHMQFVQIAE